MELDSRAALKAAAESVAVLEGQIKTLEAAAERAATAAEEAASELEKYAGLESEITSWRVEQLKRRESTKALPNDLKARVDGKRAAIDELDQSESTSRAIAAELSDVRRKLDLASKQRTKYAVAALQETAGPLVEELRAINLRRVELRQILEGMASIEGVSERTGQRERIGLTESAREVLNMGDNFIFPGNVDPTSEIGRRWILRFNALCADPNAVVVPPKHLAPSDYVPGQPPKFQGPGLSWAPGTPSSWAPEQA